MLLYILDTLTWPLLYHPLRYPNQSSPDFSGVSSPSLNLSGGRRPSPSLRRSAPEGERAGATIIRPRSATAKDFAFTHLLHSRYPSKPDLAAYSAHPAHVAVVKNDILPICDGIMALAWETPAHLTNPISPAPGSAVRLTLAKLKDEVESSVLAAAIAGVEDSEVAKSAVQVSYGENLSPARAKGYGVGFLAVYLGLEEMDKMEGEVVEEYKEKVRPLLESVIVVDFVIPELPLCASI